MRLLPVLLGLAACAVTQKRDGFPVPAIPHAPERYLCHRALRPPRIDGLLEREVWERAPWTDAFVDIEGPGKPRPRFRTRAKMLWDDDHFYVAAVLEEPHVWGTLTERDSVIFHDNDFELFVDPDGDTHEYYELEINALGTEWDLFLVKPYRDGGPALDAWDIQGLKTAVRVDGTCNVPTDLDRGWSVEMAIPWKVLGQAAHRPAPPKPGDQWHVNFSRVQWDHRVVDGRYVKRKRPEHNWVWSPQGLVNMHYPEMWGLVQFSGRAPGDRAEPWRARPHDEARWFLRRVYYIQKAHRKAYGSTASSVALKPPPGYRFTLHVTPTRFEAVLTHGDGTRLSIGEDGRLRSGR